MNDGYFYFAPILQSVDNVPRYYTMGSDTTQSLSINGQFVTLEVFVEWAEQQRKTAEKNAELREQAVDKVGEGEEGMSEACTECGRVHPAGDDRYHWHPYNPEHLYCVCRPDDLATAIQQHDAALARVRELEDGLGYLGPKSMDLAGEKLALTARIAALEGALREALKRVCRAECGWLFGIFAHTPNCKAAVTHARSVLEGKP